MQLIFQWIPTQLKLKQVVNLTPYASNQQKQQHNNNHNNNETSSHLRGGQQENESKSNKNMIRKKNGNKIHKKLERITKTSKRKRNCVGFSLHHFKYQNVQNQIH